MTKIPSFFQSTLSQKLTFHDENLLHLSVYSITEVNSAVPPLSLRCNILRDWIDLPGLRHGKLFIGRTCKKRTYDLLKLSRHQIKMVIAIYTGNAPLWGHLFTMGLLDGDPICRFIRDADRNSAAHYSLLRDVGSSAL